ncbi:Do/DeqQ family serine protease [Chitinophaga costaii]|uniref:Do/DeqQ family serine protease n=1 Tax=Chitinophaga costaii TaxID=1335309 RepID=A0A1C4ES45_9BACT|nr:trypsin-like peptidase domain-containing protein [Chitinophaga costaii]PUZ22557.1 PDZ domain-containing protein [Chitinophaga costaii]SCC46425.1 Do/DeqQ family serine protease [Chitinophaga costaii]
MKLKQIAATILISAVTALASVFVYSKYLQPRVLGKFQNGSQNIPVNYTSYMPGTKTMGSGPADFTEAARVAAPGVVHIKTKTNPRQISNNLQRSRSILQDLFGDDYGGEEENGGRYYTPGQMASGSGVMISDDGYIVTNNHVVEGADEINVTLNDYKTYKAKVVGADPGTDLALIKINAAHLPYVLYGNSDDVQIGQWVLAIGYPLNLETTVTAGIVSAKARSIGINRSGGRNSAIESFIQTDAAVNQGNSGGALINTNGELVGINSAIASPTGSYAGYSYAIPVNLVKKVVNDLLKYGNVQRAYLGVQYFDPARMSMLSDDQLASAGISRDVEGVVVSGVIPNSAAAAAGIQKSDVITKVNGVATPSSPTMTEQIARFKPGDKISITFLHNNKEVTRTVELKNINGNTNIVKETILDKMGADLRTLDRKDAASLGIAGGVLVNGIGSGLIKQQTNMKEGFVILKAGVTNVTTVEQLQSVLEKTPNVKLQGIYPDTDGVYYYNISTGSGLAL